MLFAFTISLVKGGAEHGLLSAPTREEALNALYNTSPAGSEFTLEDPEEMLLGQYDGLCYCTTGMSA